MTAGPLLYGIGYKRRSGKSTAANLLVSLLLDRDAYADVIVCNFADALKIGIGEGVFGLTQAQLHGDKKEELDPTWGFTPRQLLQKSGTALREHVAADVWVTALMRRVDALREQGTHVIIADVRYENEAEAILLRGGSMIQIVRPTDRPFSQEDRHPSETELDGWPKWDHTIHNNGTIHHLMQQLREALPPAA